MNNFCSLQLPKVIAHRGMSRRAPENTLASLQKTYEYHMPWLEFDVMLTADHVPVVFHDESLERLCGINKLISNTNYSELLSYDIGSWFSKEFSEQRIPSFQSYLEHCAQFNLGINVEIKPSVGQEFATAQAVIKGLHQYWSLEKPLLVSSFSITSLAVARVLDERIPLGLLVDEWFENWFDVLKQLNCVSLHANEAILTAEKVAQIKNAGFLVLAYTVDDPARAQTLFSWGVDAVFSNVPDLINTLRF